MRDSLADTSNGCILPTVVILVSRLMTAHSCSPSRQV